MSSNIASSNDAPEQALRLIQDSIEHATHLLPTQGPISVFVHHNTLHALEDEPFDIAVRKAHHLFRAEPYLSEDRYHQELSIGRITVEDIDAELMQELGEHYDQLLSIFGTRFSLRKSMLCNRIHFATGPVLRWTLNETSVLAKFQNGMSYRDQQLAIDNLKRWIAKDHTDLESHLLQFAIDMQGGVPSESSPRQIWESFYLKLLWQVCLFHAKQNWVPASAVRHLRPRDIVHEEFGRDPDLLVHEQLIKFCSSFIDQGFANIPLPYADRGFAKSFARLYTLPFSLRPSWMKRLDLIQVLSPSWNPLQSISESLDRFRISMDQRDSFIQQTLLALPGWTGMLWQLETNVPWAPRSVPSGTLHEFLAIRLLLDEAAAGYCGEFNRPSIHTSRRRLDEAERLNVTAAEELAFVVFQLAQLRGWDATQLVALESKAWSELTKEVVSFDSISRRCILQRAYERRYRQSALNAFAIHSQQRFQELSKRPTSSPSYQIITCIDDREESFRRLLEEIEPTCETFAAAGFFAVAMYYQGEREAFFRPLCPVNVVPKHFVREEPLFSAEVDSAKAHARRKWIGTLSQSIHFGSRGLVGGSATALLGSVASIPMIARILMPRLTSKVRSIASILIEQPSTELHLERTEDQPGKENGSLGYSQSEMADIVIRILQDIGMTRHFASIVLVLGHGSSSLNNPHESAYNCGACSGGRGGPNARAFAIMANHPQVREIVKKRGIDIPAHVHFLSGYHNTCNDAVHYFDLDHLPLSHRELFRKMEADINKARSANAHERSRRFFSIPTTCTPEESLLAVEQRSEDLSQARPEYNHATNAMCYVGRREWTRGLFMDRRSFLVSYDPTQDGEAAQILSRILAAVIPVCGGINLEYYFSTVDNEVYGCGSKLPHNIVSLAGVMTGAASDLRPGLSAQMVEIHEPLRILFLIETTPAKMQCIIDGNPQIKLLVHNAWVQLATFQIENGAIHRFINGEFQIWKCPNHPLASAKSSLDWYQGKREHLDFAQIFASASLEPQECA